MTKDIPGKTECEVSEKVIERLPRYYRQLKRLIDNDIYRISSGALAELMGLNPSQIRQDLNCFGGFGQKGYGYNVKYLYTKISELLGVNDGLSAIIIGAGNLGKAILRSGVLRSAGVTLVGIFDSDENVIGKSVSGRTVYSVEKLEKFLNEKRADIAVVSTSKYSQAYMPERLKKFGIKGIWNFTEEELRPVAGVAVKNVRLEDCLLRLCYEIKTTAGQTDDDSSTEDAYVENAVIARQEGDV